MGQLYGHKWASQSGPIKHKNGQYTQEFLLWCRKLEGLTDEQYQRGFYQLEFLVREAAKLGDEAWPPSYAGFLGYCETPHGEISHKLFPKLALPDKTAQERAKKAGEAELEKMKGLF